MNKIILSVSIAMFISLIGCGGNKPTTTTTNNTSNAANTANKPANSENKTTETATTAGSPSSVVKDIYDNAMKRNCSAIPPMLTEDFRKAVGTSKDELEALCDSFTDSGKITAFEVKSENITGDSAKVKVALTYKDGKKEDKDENVKKSNGKWLMDS